LVPGLSALKAYAGGILAISAHTVAETAVGFTMALAHVPPGGLDTRIETSTIGVVSFVLGFFGVYWTTNDMGRSA
jgi:hypothetical protein